MTNNSDKEIMLNKIPCIHYSVWFQEEQVEVLLNSGSNVNAMNPDFAWKLGFYIWKTNVRAQKINDSALKTFGMMIADF